MKIETLEPATDPRWQRLLERADSNLFHSPQWANVLHDSYAFDVLAYVLLDASAEPIAGIPFCRLADIAGPRICSLPFSDYCGPLFEPGADYGGLLEALKQDDIPVQIRSLCDTQSLPNHDWQMTRNAACHRLNLEVSLEDLWNGLHGASRRAIRKARKSGVTVANQTDNAALEEFFRQQLRVRKDKYRLLVQPYHFFANIRTQFRTLNSYYLLVASLDDKPIASTLLLGWKDCLYYKFNASKFDTLSHRPNDLIVWQAIELAKREGYKTLDFGLSAMDQPGLIRFKAQFGALQQPIRFFQYTSQQTEQRSNVVQDLLRQVTHLMTDPSVPDDITIRAAEQLYRNFA